MFSPLKYTYSQEIKEVMVNSINLCLENISEDGHFPYDEKHSGVYILLYHSSVMFYLNECLKSNYINNEIKTKINEKNGDALNYLINCMDEEFRFNDPEKDSNSFYIITAVTSLAALRGRISKDKEEMILRNILKHYSDNKLFLFNDRDNYLTNRSLYKFIDVLTIETLYWIVQHICGKNI